MSCSPFDLRDYFLKELTSPQQFQVEAHIKTCTGCRDEMERLRITEAALFSLRDEEIPQRIGFVSDKIFEPSPMRRWFAAFWGSTARLGFASAVVLSVAMSFSAWRRTPAPAAGTPETAVVKPAAVPAALTPADMDRRIQEAVVKAVADLEARYAEQNRVQLADFKRETEFARQRLEIAAANFEMSERHWNNDRGLGMVTGPVESGDPKGGPK
jgi:hypothetical protein